MIKDFSEFDFFMDEDTRSRRVGTLCLEKTLTPALTQALFRVKESASDFHKKRVDHLALEREEKKKQLRSTHKQLREIKWSSLNLMRSYVAVRFIQSFFYYFKKGPLPIAFFNTPFVKTHECSINYFFEKLPGLGGGLFGDAHNSDSVFFLDTFTTKSGYRFEERVRNTNNLSRCFRIDSRAHDIMQLTDLLLGVTVFFWNNKKTSSSAKVRVSEAFISENAKCGAHQCIYYL